MIRTNLEIYRGDDKTWNLTFRDSTGDSIDITGSTVWLTVKSSISDPDESALIQKQVTTHSNPTQGETQISLLPVDTSDVSVGRYEYDMQLIESSGKITTFMRGVFSISQDITIST